VSSPCLLLTRPADGVALLTLNRPEVLNALSFELHAAVDQALTELEADDSVRAIVITGAGDRAFSAGNDVHEMEPLNEDEMLLGYLRREPWRWHSATCRKPLLAAVNGLAYGDGAVLAIAADIRIGCPRTVFRVTACAYGGVMATWCLPPIVGFGKAKEWLLTSRKVGADEALAAGLLSQLVDVDEVVPATVEVASLIAANPARATEAVKAMIHHNVGLGYEDAHHAESSMMSHQLRPGRVSTLFSAFLSTRRRSPSTS
jgi:2-(1,2-epoxy-1,2-dihydrophenyl)acetyl-CoA isomerase